MMLELGDIKRFMLVHRLDLHVNLFSKDSVDGKYCSASLGFHFTLTGARPRTLIRPC